MHLVIGRSPGAILTSTLFFSVRTTLEPDFDLRLSNYPLFNYLELLEIKFSIIETTKLKL